MNLRTLTALATLALSTAAFADGRFERTLPTGAQPDLYVSTGSGNISIHPGDGAAIKITGHIHAGWSAFGNIDERIRRIESNPPIAQSGNEVHVGETNDHDLYQNISIDYDIAVPAATALNLRSGSGDIKSEGVGRYLSAATGSGNIHTSGSRGESHVASGSGDITVDLNSGSNTEARTGSGNIRISGFNGTLSARSGSGDIEASGRLSGPAKISSGSGNVTLHLTPDAHFNLEATTGSGNMNVRYPNAPQQGLLTRHHLTGPINGGGAPLEVRTGSGNVDIDGNRPSAALTTGQTIPTA
jgi:hypothetical protein